MSSDDPLYPADAEPPEALETETELSDRVETPAEGAVLDEETSAPPPPRVMRPHPTPDEVRRSPRVSVVRLSTWTLLLAVLLALTVLPILAERIQYALTRGEQRAKAEVARQMLDTMPEVESRLVYVSHVVIPSVVDIETTQVSQELPRDEQELYLGIPQFHTEGIGSGVIIDPAGYVVTNNHVIDQASEITVRLSDGTPIHDVEVVGRDRLTDLAVLKIEGGPFEAARWGDSDDLEAGDPVLAVGNPFGFELTVTSGIISATGRKARTSSLAHQDFLQTDAAVNPGSSGGPLVNMLGEVVGINTAIYGEKNLGISFAIPSSIAKEVYEGLRKHGRISRGWLGVAMRDVNEDVAEEFGLDEETGALVTDVIPRSPAARAGMERYDVIVGWNDTRVEISTDLSRAVAETKVGTSATVTVLRDGTELALDVAVGERPVQMD